MVSTLVSHTQIQGQAVSAKLEDFDLRGNNPNKEDWRYRSAKNQLDLAELALKTAVQYAEMLRQAPPKRALPSQGGE
jgi:hypothetical protein